MKTKTLSFLVSIFILFTFTGCQNETGQLKSNTKTTFSNIYKNVSINYTEIRSTQLDDCDFSNGDIDALKYDENKITEYDTLKSFYEKITDDYRANDMILKGTLGLLGRNFSTGKTHSDTLYHDSLRKWNETNHQKYICYSNYLRTLRAHPERYKNHVVVIKTSFVQYFEIVINDKLSYFGKVQIDGVNGKITPESIDRIKSSYKEFLKFKTEVGGC